MVKLFVTALVSLLLLTPASAQTSPPNCVTADVFITKQKDIIKMLFKLPDQYIPEFEAILNKNIQNRGLPPVSVSSFYVAVLTNGNYGLAYFRKDGCIEPRSVIQMAPKQFVEVLMQEMPLLEKLEVVVDG